MNIGCHQSDRIHSLQNSVSEGQGRTSLLSLCPFSAFPLHIDSDVREQRGKIPSSRDKMGPCVFRVRKNPNDVHTVSKVT